jgi:hypothetical protein
MTTVGKLLTRKQGLIARLRGNLSPDERSEIECMITRINTALDLLVQPSTKDQALSVADAADE